MTMQQQQADLEELGLELTEEDEQLLLGDPGNLGAMDVQGAGAVLTGGEEDDDDDDDWLLDTDSYDSLKLLRNIQERKTRSPPSVRGHTSTTSPATPIPVSTPCPAIVTTPSHVVNTPVSTVIEATPIPVRPCPAIVTTPSHVVNTPISTVIEATPSHVAPVGTSHLAVETTPIPMAPVGTLHPVVEATPIPVVISRSYTATPIPVAPVGTSHPAVEATPSSIKTTPSSSMIGKSNLIASKSQFMDFDFSSRKKSLIVPAATSWSHWTQAKSDSIAAASDDLAPSKLPSKVFDCTIEATDCAMETSFDCDVMSSGPRFRVRSGGRHIIKLNNPGTFRYVPENLATVGVKRMPYYKRGTGTGDLRHKLNNRSSQPTIKF